MSFVSIGTLSKQSGTKVETVRYYERIGLLQEPARTEGGHRLYKISDQKRLRFIRRCRELGFSIVEIRTFLAMVDGGSYTCGQVKNLTDLHIEDITKKIEDLVGLRERLVQMEDRCQTASSPECPLLDNLFAD